MRSDKFTDWRCFLEEMELSRFQRLGRWGNWHKHLWRAEPVGLAVDVTGEEWLETEGGASREALGS